MGYKIQEYKTYNNLYDLRESLMLSLFRQAEKIQEEIDPNCKPDIRMDYRLYCLLFQMDEKESKQLETNVHCNPNKEVVIENLFGYTVHVVDYEKTMDLKSSTMVAFC